MINVISNLHILICSQRFCSLIDLFIANFTYVSFLEFYILYIKFQNL